MAIMNLANKLIIAKKYLSFKITSDEKLHFAGETVKCTNLSNCYWIGMCCRNPIDVYRDEDQWGFLYPQWYEFLSLCLILVLFISIYGTLSWGSVWWGTVLPVILCCHSLIKVTWNVSIFCISCSKESMPVTRRICYQSSPCLKFILGQYEWC